MVEVFNLFSALGREKRYEWRDASYDKKKFVYNSGFE